MRKLSIGSLLFTLIFLFTTDAFGQRITVTIAGTSSGGFSGDGGSCKQAKLAGPLNVCSDAAHNLYVLDNNRIRKISATGSMIATVVGGGSLSGDGIPATSSSIVPQYMCVDASGNIYIPAGNQIKKVDAVTGLISTFAGQATSGYSGDGGPSTLASLSSPTYLCVNSVGDMFFYDAGNAYIREINSSGTISTIAGNGTAGFSGDGGPALLAEVGDISAIGVSSSGDIFFAEHYGEEIREIDAATRYINLVAGGGGLLATPSGIPATNASLLDVDGIYVDASGDVYMNDVSCTCSKFDTRTNKVYLLAGGMLDEYNGDNGNSLSICLNSPAGLCVDDKGNIFIADNYNNRIRKSIKLSHTPTFAFGKSQFIKTCNGYSAYLDSQMMITDIDTAQIETWSVVTSPVHGKLTGFPASGSSFGQYSTLIGTGMAYLASGTYTGMDSFRVQVSDGSLSDTVTIYVSVAYTSKGPGSIAGSDSVCVGSGLTLVDTVVGGAWSSSNTAISAISPLGIVSALMPGNATVRFSITNSCGVATSTKTITVDQLPALGTMPITGSGNVCKGVTITLSDIATGGLWKISNANAGISGTGVVTGIAAGMDTVIYVITNSCGTEDTTFVIAVDDCITLGNITPVPVTELRVFPNPAVTTLNVAWNNWIANNRITITDVIGREALHKDFSKESSSSMVEQIDISVLMPGIYFLKVNSSEVSKFIKQ